MDSDRSAATAWLLLCADGKTHREGDHVPHSETRENAQGAAEFMDEKREDGIGWTCGPHAVAPWPEVVVGVDQVARCTCGWNSGSDDQPVAAGARHLNFAHGIYAGGTYV